MIYLQKVECFIDPKYLRRYGKSIVFPEIYAGQDPIVLEKDKITYYFSQHWGISRRHY